MTKMQEAFETVHCGNNPHTTRKNSTTGDYVLPSVQDAWSGFQTGYQAAIAELGKQDPGFHDVAEFYKDATPTLETEDEIERMRRLT